MERRFLQEGGCIEDKHPHQVAVVDLGVDAGGGVPPVGGGDELDAAGVVIRGHAAHGLEFGQDDERTAVHVEQGVHGTRCRKEKEEGEEGQVERRRGREGEWQEGCIIGMCMSKGVQGKLHRKGAGYISARKLYLS